MNRDIHIDINSGNGLTLSNYPALTIDETQCKQIVSATINHIFHKHAELTGKSVSLSLYFVDAAEGKQLNHDYRGKDYATNVLSFPSNLPSDILLEMDEYPLGELIFCLPVVKRESTEQHKIPQHHFSHLLVHGCLHLLGYDHELSDTVTEQDAQAMENLEIQVLNDLDISNPYT